MAVWPVRDCGRITYQDTRKVKADYKPSHTTETLIGYDRVLCIVIFLIVSFNVSNGKYSQSFF